MENLIKILLLMLMVKSYSQVINIKDAGKFSNAPGQYYKDIDHELDPYVGTWLYTNGSTTLKFEFVKVENLSNSRWSEDYIIGGYEYKIGSTILVNTIPDIPMVYINPIQHKVHGNRIFKKNNYPLCPECDVNELRLSLTFNEIASTMVGTLILRKTMVGGQEAIKLNLDVSGTITYLAGTPPPPSNFTVPVGDYVLIKQ